MAQTYRDQVVDLAERAKSLANGRRPDPKTGSASLAASARAASAIWTSLVTAYDQRESWLKDRDQVVGVLRLARREAVKAVGLHPAEPEDLAESLVNEFRQLTDDPNLCPNGQRAPECTEIDPCESCWGDLEAEGDEIEESMGLR